MSDNVFHLRPLPDEGDPVQKAHGLGVQWWALHEAEEVGLRDLLDVLDGDESVWFKIEFVRGVLDGRRGT